MKSTTTARQTAATLRRLDHQLRDDMTFSRASRLAELVGTIVSETRTALTANGEVTQLTTRSLEADANLGWTLAHHTDGLWSLTCCVVDDSGESALVRGLGPEVLDFVFRAENPLSTHCDACGFAHAGRPHSRD